MLYDSLQSLRFMQPNTYTVFKGRWRAADSALTFSVDQANEGGLHFQQRCVVECADTGR